jgi:hypothetical protein
METTTTGSLSQTTTGPSSSETPSLQSETKIQIVPKLSRKDLQARKRFELDGVLISEAYYPEIPAGWPNRATRRAVQKNRLDRLSPEWKQVFQDTTPSGIPGTSRGEALFEAIRKMT